MADWLDRAGVNRRAFRAEFATRLAVQLQYRTALLVWLVFFVLKPVIFLSVWSAVARSTGGPAATRRRSSRRTSSSRCGSCT
jgi:hypothetical protein